MVCKCCHFSFEVKLDIQLQSMGYHFLFYREGETSWSEAPGARVVASLCHMPLLRSHMTRSWHSRDARALHCRHNWQVTVVVVTLFLLYSHTMCLMNLACSLCSSGAPKALPYKALDISGLPFKNYFQLSQAIETLFTQYSEICSTFQSVGALCGCKPVIDNSCQEYCPDGGNIAYPNKLFTFLTNQFAGIAPNCEVFAAYAQSLNAKSK
jgi:hypothetical protein